MAEHAFHATAASNATIRTLLNEKGLPDSVATRLRMLAINNHLHLFEYAPGIAVVESVVADSGRISSETLNDARNYGRILRALKEVPPQTLKRRGDSRISLVEGRIPVAFQGGRRQALRTPARRRRSVVGQTAFRHVGIVPSRACQSSPPRQVAGTDERPGIVVPHRRRSPRIT